MKGALINAAVIGSGGFLGALARWALNALVQRQIPLANFPYGTLAVNCLGCLLIGVVAGLVESRGLFGPEARAFALIGVLGGFTTFSTFGYETVQMVREAAHLRAAVNVGSHVLIGLALVWLGYTLVTADPG